MNLYGIKIWTFYLHFSTITRGGATEFSKRKDCSTAQSFDAWRAKHAWLSHEERSPFVLHVHHYQGKDGDCQITVQSLQVISLYECDPAITNWSKISKG